MEFKNLGYEIEDGVARLTLARPPRNSIFRVEHAG